MTLTAGVPLPKFIGSRPGLETGDVAWNGIDRILSRLLLEMLSEERRPWNSRAGQCSQEMRRRRLHTSVSRGLLTISAFYRNVANLPVLNSSNDRTSSQSRVEFIRVRCRLPSLLYAPLSEMVDCQLGKNRRRIPAEVSCCERSGAPAPDVCHVPPRIHKEQNS